MAVCHLQVDHFLLIAGEMLSVGGNVRLSTDYLCSSAVNRVVCKVKGKGKGFPYLIRSVGPEADPSVQAVSPQVTVSHTPGGSCHYFPPGL